MWVSSEPSRKIQLSGSGKLTKGVKASAITPAMLMIRVMLTSASSPNLTSTFQAACITAASRTSRVHPRERVTRQSDRRQVVSESGRDPGIPARVGANRLDRWEYRREKAVRCQMSDARADASDI